jgi:hypothetical protein
MLVFSYSRPTVLMMLQGTSVGLSSETFTASGSNSIITSSQSTQMLANEQFNSTSTHSTMMEFVKDSEICSGLMTLGQKLIAASFLKSDF